MNVEIHGKTHMRNEDSIATHWLVMWKSKSMYTVRGNWKMNEQNCLFKLSGGTTQLCMITLERNTNWNGRVAFASQMVLMWTGACVCMCVMYKAGKVEVDVVSVTFVKICTRKFYCLKLFISIIIELKPTVRTASAVRLLECPFDRKMYDGISHWIRSMYRRHHRHHQRMAEDSMNDKYSKWTIVRFDSLPT